MTPRISGHWLIVPFDGNQLIADLRHGVPEIVHIGPALSDATIAGLGEALVRPRARASIDGIAPATMCPEHGSGWFGRPGLAGRRPDGSAWAPRFVPESEQVADETEGENFAVIGASDPVAELRLTTAFDGRGKSVRVRHRLENLGSSTYGLDELTVTVAIPCRAAQIVHLVGRWSHEFQIRRVPWIEGSVSFDNRRGRTSHDRVPALFVGTEGFDDNHGDVWGFALGWSGNTIVSAERLTDGRRVVQMGELLAPGDVAIEPGGAYETPWLEIAVSTSGTNAVSQAFHHSIRSRAIQPGPDRPRPILLNTWEAVYFDHDLDTLRDLATAAADVGVERFVLDDGWFHGRRSDDAGLGDWWVDESVWPDGLEPLIDHVVGLGLEFGIWVEPEMVNRDSDLYRSHPDWVLSARGYEAIEQRNQLVLDLGRPEVFTYLLEKLDALFGAHEISYVKWDMNRDLVHASTGDRASSHTHMLAVYRLLDELRERHPSIEIESCASGGGRADFEILERTERIWTSDCNDALERQRIQRGFSMLFPPEVMGAHIGPPRAHVSGRRHSLAFRAATAFVGHLGLEWNVLQANDGDRALLRDVLAAHKQHRELLHRGLVYRLESDDEHALASIVVAADRTEALLSFAQLDLPSVGIPPPVRLVGLDAGSTYSVTALTCFGPLDLPRDQVTPWAGDRFEATGESLMMLGLQPPLLQPEAAFVAHLRSA